MNSSELNFGDSGLTPTAVSKFSDCSRVLVGVCFFPTYTSNLAPDPEIHLAMTSASAAGHALLLLEGLCGPDESSSREESMDETLNSKIKNQANSCAACCVSNSVQVCSHTFCSVALSYLLPCNEAQCAFVHWYWCRLEMSTIVLFGLKPNRFAPVRMASLRNRTKPNRTGDIMA